MKTTYIRYNFIDHRYIRMPMITVMCRYVNNI